MEINVDVESIKQECIDIFNSMTESQKSTLVKESMSSIQPVSSLQTKSENFPSSMLPPIYYLFDHEINHNIGCTPNSIRTLNEYLKIDTMFELIPTNIIDVNIPKHSTKIYKITILRRYYVPGNYIYYSNSGFGSENQIKDQEGYICPSIFYIKDVDYFNFIPLFINSILDFIVEHQMFLFQDDPFNLPEIKEHLEKINTNINMYSFPKLLLDDTFKELIK